MNNFIKKYEREIILFGAILIVLSFCLHTFIKDFYPEFYINYYRKIFWVSIDSAISIIFGLYSILFEKAILKNLCIVFLGASLGMVLAEIVRTKGCTNTDLLSVVGLILGIIIVVINHLRGKV